MVVFRDAPFQRDAPFRRNAPLRSILQQNRVDGFFGDLIVGSGDVVGDVFFGLDEVPAIFVDRILSEEIIAVDGILLSDPVRPVFGLLAVGEGPRKLDKRHPAAGGKGQPYPRRFVVAENQTAGRIGLKPVHCALTFRGRLAAREDDGAGKLRADFCDHLF